MPRKVIKALRKGAGLSQEEFGARLNVSRQAITKKSELTLVFE